MIPCFMRIHAGVILGVDLAAGINVYAGKQSRMIRVVRVADHERDDLAGIAEVLIIIGIPFVDLSEILRSRGIDLRVSVRDAVRGEDLSFGRYIDLRNGLAAASAQETREGGAKSNKE